MSKQDNCLLCAMGSTAALAVANIGLCGIILIGRHSNWFRVALPVMMIASLMVIVTASRVMWMVWKHRNDP